MRACATIAVSTVVTTAAMLGLSSSAAASSAQRPQPAACVLIRVSGPTAETSGRGGGFSAHLVEDLTITVLFPGKLNEKHVLALDFSTPKGFLYQTITLPVAAPGTPPAERAIEGYPRPLRELVPQVTTIGTSRLYWVEVPFPVGGTMIVTASLYGLWHVAPRLDGATMPCAPPTGFTIVP